MTSKLGNIVLTMFGVGYISKLPGTIASLITCLIFYIFCFFFSIKNILIPFIIFLIIISIFSIFFINKIYKNEDSKEIVIDEFVGQNIPLLAWYNVDLNSSVIFSKYGLDLYSLEIWIILSFILFRFFDILKPFPINLVDNRIKNGFGVIFDDIVAGIFSTATLYIIFI